MKNRGILFVVLGFILLGIGGGLLVSTSPASSDLVFYIFPFFLVNTSGNMFLIVLIVSLVVFSLLLTMKQFSNPVFYHKSIITCHFCKEQIHHSSVFCPRCGKRIELEGVN